MSPLLVVLCYGSAMAISLLLLWHFGAVSWLLHSAALVLAFVIGLTPMPETWTGVAYTLAVGWAFLLLFVWGIGGLLLKLIHVDRHFSMHPR
jgi:hypothetical protein